MTVEPQGVVVVVDREEQLLPLLSGGYRIATNRGELLILIAVSEADAEPDWLKIPSHYDQTRIETQVVPLANVVKRVSRLLRDKPPTFVVLGMEIGGRSLVREELMPLMERIKCPVAVVRRKSEFKRNGGRSSLFVPFQNDEDSRFTVRTALSLDPDAIVTAAMVAPPPMEDSERLSQERELEESLAEWAHEERVTPKLLVGSDAVDLLVAEAAHHDTIVMGVSHGLVFLRAAIGDTPTMLFSDVQRQLIQRTTMPAVVLRAYQGRIGVLLSSVFTRGDRFMPTLTDEERIDVYREIRRSARPTQDFFIMIGSSASIAAIGLILNSPAVIIGAMLIAPLMSAIIGMGLAIVQGDFRFFGSAGKAASRGLSLAIVIGFVIGVFEIGTEATNEMLSRSQPSVLDFLVATVSGFAGAYALSRKGVSAALPGVAIAVALVPPLAAVGLFVAMGMIQGAYGAMLLFLTNLAAVTLASAVVFTFLGFRPPPAREGDVTRYRTFQRGFLVAGLLTLGVFSHLVVLSVGEVVESHEEATARAELIRYMTGLDKDARLVEWAVEEEENERLLITASVSSPNKIESDDLPAIANALERAVDRPVQLILTRLPTGTARSKGWTR